MTHRFFLLALAALTAACASSSIADANLRSSETSSTNASARVDSLVLRLGQSRLTADGQLEVRFDNRMSDSRCPATAICVWAGDAHVKLSTRSGSGSFTTADLHSGLEPRSVSAGGYVITFAGMTPYPGSKESNDPYELILLATKK